MFFVFSSIGFNSLGEEGDRKGPVGEAATETQRDRVGGREGIRRGGGEREREEEEDWGDAVILATVIAALSRSLSLFLFRSLAISCCCCSWQRGNVDHTGWGGRGGG